MLGQLLAAQFDLETVVAKLTSAGASADAAQNQIQFLVGLQRAVGSANPVALAQMRSEITATVNAAQAVVQQTRAAASADDRVLDIRDVTRATRQTIENVAQDLFEKKKLDPYLQFVTEQDEATYREREAKRQAYIKRELAKGTPEGALNAANASVDQINDAGAHGAERSPDYEVLKQTATDARDAQLAALDRSTPGPQKLGDANAPGATTAPTSDFDLTEIAAVFKAAGVKPPPPTPIVSGDHGLAVAGIDRAGPLRGKA